ncbi:MAG: diaminopimelate decarboxylase [Pseudomonadota bacterium]
MHHFHYANGELHAEDVPLARIAEDVGTPVYVYSEATLRRHARVFQDAFVGARTLAAFSVKANSNLAVLRVLFDEGMGADVVSGGELLRALRAGLPGDRIVFSGVGKTADELKLALEAGVRQFNVESENELDVLDAVAQGLGVRAPVAFRVNPDVAAGGHAKISTGKAEDKFGVAWSRARGAYAKAAGMAGIEVKGVDVHIGSQITELAPFEAAFNRVAGLVRDLRADGHTIDRVDLGGGLGISYDGHTEGERAPPGPADYAALIRRIADPLDVELIFEPGRMIAGNAGVLLTRTIYVKEGEARRFLILDAGMNDLIRPALYDASHEILPVRQPRAAAAYGRYDVVGPVCETGDRFAQERNLPEIAEGDLCALMSAGAYGAAQASQYNTRPLVPEVLVRGADFHVIRKRPSFEEMVALEDTPTWLQG